MKKRIALFLAIVMTVALLPANVFAYTTQYVYSEGSTSRGKTLFVEYDPSTGTQGVDLSVPLEFRKDTGVADTNWDAEGIAFLQNGATYTVLFPQGVTTGDMFRLTLDGGTWSLRKNPFKNHGSEEKFKYRYLKDADNDGVYDTDGSETLVEVSPWNSNFGMIENHSGTNSGRLTYARKGSVEVTSASIDADKAYYRTIGTSMGDPNDIFKGASGGVTLGEMPVNGYLVGAQGFMVPYTMSFDSDNSALITVLAGNQTPGMPAGVASLQVPMFMFADGGKTVTAKVDRASVYNQSTTVSEMPPVVVARGTGSGTKTSFGPAIDNYELFPVNKIEITELRPGVLANSGTFKLSAQSGFEFLALSSVAGQGGSYNYNWSTPDALTGSPTNAQLAAWLKEVLDAHYNILAGDARRVTKFSLPVGGVNSDGDTKADLGFFTSAALKLDELYFEAGRNGELNTSEVFVKFSGLTKSQNFPGRITFDNVPLVLRAEENAPEGEVKVTISNNSWGPESGVSWEQPKAGNRKKYDLNYTAKGDPVELYNGQYANSGKDDGWHKATRVRFEENLAGSWNARGQTIFEVPDGVKITQVQFADSSNLLPNNSNDQAAGIISTSGAGKSLFDKEKKYESATSGQGVVGIAFGEGYRSGWPGEGWSAGGSLAGYIAVTEKSITLSGINMPDPNLRKPIWFEMDIWVTIADGFNGGGDSNVELTLKGTGAGMLDGTAVTIAKTKDPVAIKVDEVRSIKTGYQNQTVSNFTITEAKAGILRRGDIIKLSLTDGVDYDDISFVSADVSATDGNIAIRNLGVTGALGNTAKATVLNTGGTVLAFEVTRASSTASTISFENVQVKINRSIPETNAQPYQILVWGQSVGENYDESALVSRGKATHAVPGVKANYIRVGTLAGGFGMNNKVSISPDSTTVLVNGVEQTLAQAAFVDPTNDTLMVPVRFVSYALGLTDDQISWGGNPMVITLFAGESSERIIQFEIGSDRIIRDGMSFPMVAADGSGRPVKAMLKDGYSYIPFRALGEAFGIPVGWDAETGTATYNKDVVVD